MCRYAVFRFPECKCFCYAAFLYCSNQQTPDEQPAQWEHEIHMLMGGYGQPIERSVCKQGGVRPAQKFAMPYHVPYADCEYIERWRVDGWPFQELSCGQCWADPLKSKTFQKAWDIPFAMSVGDSRRPAAITVEKGKKTKKAKEAEEEVRDKKAQDDEYEKELERRKVKTITRKKKKKKDFDDSDEDYIDTGTDEDSLAPVEKATPAASLDKSPIEDDEGVDTAKKTTASAKKEPKKAQPAKMPKKKKMAHKVGERDGVYRPGRGVHDERSERDETETAKVKAEADALKKKKPLEKAIITKKAGIVKKLVEKLVDKPATKVQVSEKKRKATKSDVVEKLEEDPTPSPIPAPKQTLFKTPTTLVKKTIEIPVPVKKTPAKTPAKTPTKKTQVILGDDGVPLTAVQKRMRTIRLKKEATAKVSEDEATGGKKRKATATEESRPKRGRRNA